MLLATFVLIHKQKLRHIDQSGPAFWYRILNLFSAIFLKNSKLTPPFSSTLIMQPCLSICWLEANLIVSSFTDLFYLFYLFFINIVNGWKSGRVFTHFFNMIFVLTKHFTHVLRVVNAWTLQHFIWRYFVYCLMLTVSTGALAGAFLLTVLYSTVRAHAVLRSRSQISSGFFFLAAWSRVRI